MVHIRLAIAAIALAGVPAIAQQEASTTAQIEPKFPDKTEIMRRIDLYESAAHRAVPGDVPNESLVKIYTNLGALYEDVALYLKAEDAMRHTVALLRAGPQDQLADAIGHLAALHIAMNETHQAEKELLEAIRIRESAGDPVGIAECDIDLANLYARLGHYKQAVDHAQKAEAVIADDPKVGADSRIAARESLANALCGIHQCERAIPLLQDAIQLARESFGPDSLSVGIGYYLLGNAEWQAGNPRLAEELMKRGTDRMRVELGWGHVIYVNAMAQYAKLLRQRGEVEAASAAQHEVRQAADVVDARSFTARPQ
jgi:tetratricopeptide (TPR) repeat protein